MVLMSLRSGRLCSNVIELSLNPVFNEYAIINARDDPLVLVEVTLTLVAPSLMQACVYVWYLWPMFAWRFGGVS